MLVQQGCRNIMVLQVCAQYSIQNVCQDSLRVCAFYCRGLYDEAEALAQFSLDIAKSVYRNDENQTMLRRHRYALQSMLDFVQI